MKVDINKKYCTRDERDVIIYEIHYGQDYPVHGAILEYDEWIAQTWRLDGRINSAHASINDLVEVKENEIADRIKKLKAKLAKAEAMLEREIMRVKKIQSDLPPPHKVSLFDVQSEYELMLAELTGGKDDHTD